MILEPRNRSHPFPLGIGWRPEIAHLVDRRTDLSFLEVTAEKIDSRNVPRALLEQRDRGLTIIPHGLSLSLGGADRPDQKCVEHLATLAETFGSPFVSEHIAFVRAGGVEAGHLLPVPRTRQSLDVLVENIALATRGLPVPLALENISTLVDWPGAEMSEADFVTELLERTDTLMLLDLANVWANAKNLGGDPIETICRLPLARVAYCHVGGGFERDGVYHDTHAHPVPAGVLEVVERLFAISPHAPAVMLERDDHFPPPDVMNAELDGIAAAAERGLALRSRKVTHAG